MLNYSCWGSGIVLILGAWNCEAERVSSRAMSVLTVPGFRPVSRQSPSISSFNL